MTIVNTYYLARLVEKGEAENLRLLWANQYDRGVHVNISGAGLIKWSKNQTSAIKLLECSHQNMRKICMQGRTWNTL